jgi:hypothetical protein
MDCIGLIWMKTCLLKVCFAEISGKPDPASKTREGLVKESSKNRRDAKQGCAAV